MKNLERFLILLAVMCGAFAYTNQARAGEIEAFMKYSHTSDLLRGFPFSRVTSEPTTDYVAFGATITFDNPRWQFDFSHGLKARDCNYIQTSDTASGCKWESGTELELRWYPWRAKK